MKKIYQITMTLGIAATVTSCNRSAYAPTQYSGIYSPVEQVCTLASPDATARVVLPAAALNTAPPKASIAAGPTLTRPASVPTVGSRLAMRPKVLLLRKLARQVTKAQASRPATAEVAQATSNKGNSALIALIGLVIILIGGLIGGTNIVVTIGGIVFIVGLILFIIALIDGK